MKATQDRSGPATAAPKTGNAPQRDGEAAPMPPATESNPARRALFDLSNEISVPLHTLQGLIDLLMWVENTREAESRLRLFGKHIPAVGEILKKYEIYPTEWEKVESEGLTTLHWVIRDMLSKVAQEVEDAPAGVTSHG